MGLIVKDILKSRGISIKDFAALLGINRVNLSNQLSGNPTLETLEKWAAALNVTVPDLFDKKITAINCPKCGEEIRLSIDEKS
ncbi:helix-turn-helix transcriptional regulator [uncultured Proteiniphilum sp.]|uniref:helix-turn-helix domain-containing protein n=1 Tax=uncultured Proteiniphilum sp. TaxID=497637 RepID=UPI00260A6573|nr:helix-turn-helix transcriptional regulator [uncultured Proteiniphilum sp.]